MSITTKGGVKVTLKGYRANNGISQEAVAKLLGITQSAYSKKENNPDSFKPSELRKISNAYRISLSDLYDYLLGEQEWIEHIFFVTYMS